MTIDERQRAVATARRYIGTPFQWGGRNRHGMDCVGLIVISLGLSNDAPNLPDYANAPESAMVYRHVRDYADRLKSTDARAGDIVLMHCYGRSSHFGLLNGTGGVIHADRALGRVVEQKIEATDMRVVAFYRLKPEMRNGTSG